MILAINASGHPEIMDNDRPCRCPQTGRGSRWAWAERRSAARRRGRVRCTARRMERASLTASADALRV